MGEEQCHDILCNDACRIEDIVDECVHLCRRARGLTNLEHGVGRLTTRITRTSRDRITSIHSSISTKSSSVPLGRGAIQWAPVTKTSSMTGSPPEIGSTSTAGSNDGCSPRHGFSPSDELPAYSCASSA